MLKHRKVNNRKASSTKDRVYYNIDNEGNITTSKESKRTMYEATRKEYPTNGRKEQNRNNNYKRKNK